MIIPTARNSLRISRCHQTATTRNTTRLGRRPVLSPGRFPNPRASFSSAAPPQLRTPVHPYTFSLASLSPLRGSLITDAMDLPAYGAGPSVLGDERTEKESGSIRNIQDFVDRIPEAVRKTENIEPGAFDDPVARLFRRSDLPPHAWQKYALFDNTKPYTRNLISTDHETYTLLLLCWNPEQESPIHDHPCDGCWLQVLGGGIEEVRYDRQLNRVSQIDYSKGDLSYITDNVGYHKVGNPTRAPAVTLHLYAPPFETCQCWHGDKADISEPTEGRTVNHSEYGIIAGT